jgi:hypothetical protein
MIPKTQQKWSPKGFVEGSYKIKRSERTELRKITELHFCRNWNDSFLKDKRFARIAQFRSREELDILREPLKLSIIYIGPFCAVWESAEGVIGEVRNKLLCLLSGNEIYESVTEVFSSLHRANER